MNETLIEQIQADASALDIKITAREIALYLSEKKVPPEHLEAMKEFMSYLRQNQRDGTAYIPDVFTDDDDENAVAHPY